MPDQVVRWAWYPEHEMVSVELGVIANCTLPIMLKGSEEILYRIAAGRARALVPAPRAGTFTMSIDGVAERAFDDTVRVSMDLSGPDLLVRCPPDTQVAIRAATWDGDAPVSQDVKSDARRDDLIVAEVPPAAIYGEIECSVDPLRGGLQGPRIRRWRTGGRVDVDVSLSQPHGSAGSALDFVVRGDGREVIGEAIVTVRRSDIRFRPHVFHVGLRTGKTPCSVPTLHNGDLVTVSTSPQLRLHAWLQDRAGEWSLLREASFLATGSPVEIRPANASASGVASDLRAALTDSRSNGAAGLGQIRRRLPGLQRALEDCAAISELVANPSLSGRILDTPTDVLVQWTELLKARQGSCAERRSARSTMSAASALDLVLQRPEVAMALIDEPALAGLMQITGLPSRRGLIDRACLVTVGLDERRATEIAGWLRARGSDEVSRWERAREQGVQPGLLARLSYELGLHASAFDLQGLAEALEMIDASRLGDLAGRLVPRSRSRLLVERALSTLGPQVRGTDGSALVAAARTVSDVVRRQIDPLRALGREAPPDDPEWRACSEIATALESNLSAGLHALKALEERVPDAPPGGPLLDEHELVVARRIKARYAQRRAQLLEDAGNAVSWLLAYAEARDVPIRPGRPTADLNLASATTAATESLRWLIAEAWVPPPPELLDEITEIEQILASGVEDGTSHFLSATDALARGLSATDEAGRAVLSALQVGRTGLLESLQPWRRRATVERLRGQCRALAATIAETIHLVGPALAHTIEGELGPIDVALTPMSGTPPWAPIQRLRRLDRECREALTRQQEWAQLLDGVAPELLTELGLGDRPLRDEGTARLETTIEGLATRQHDAIQQVLLEAEAVLNAAHPLGLETIVTMLGGLQGTLSPGLPLRHGADVIERLLQEQALHMRLFLAREGIGQAKAMLNRGIRALLERQSTSGAVPPSVHADVLEIIRLRERLFPGDEGEPQLQDILFLAEDDESLLILQRAAVIAADLLPYLASPDLRAVALAALRRADREIAEKSVDVNMVRKELIGLLLMRVSKFRRAATAYLTPDLLPAETPKAGECWRWLVRARETAKSDSPAARTLAQLLRVHQLSEHPTEPPPRGSVG